jgi:hypothetical protein
LIDFILKEKSVFSNKKEKMMSEVFTMNRPCNCKNKGKGQLCSLCNSRTKRLDAVPRGLNPVKWFYHGDSRRIKDVVARVWYRCGGCSVLSFAPDPRTLALVTVDGSPVLFDSLEQEDKIVLVTKGEGCKLDTMDEKTRLQQFDCCLCRRDEENKKRFAFWQIME